MRSCKERVQGQELRVGRRYPAPHGIKTLPAAQLGQGGHSLSPHSQNPGRTGYWKRRRKPENREGIQGTLPAALQGDATSGRQKPLDR